MRLLLIRHALPTRVDGLAGIAADPPLAPLGRRQAGHLRDYLAGERLDAVWTSPMRRATQTAAPLAELAGVAAEVAEDLAEFDRHAPSYVPAEEWLPGDARSMALADGRLAEFFGVDGGTFRDRAVGAVERIVSAHPGRTVAIVTHGGILNAYLAHVLGLDVAFFFRPHYTGISRVLAGGATRTVESLNEHAHVRDLLSRSAGPLASSGRALS